MKIINKQINKKKIKMDQATAARVPAEVVGWHALPREVEAMVLAHLPPLHALRLATVSSSWHSVRHISPALRGGDLLTADSPHRL